MVSVTDLQQFLRREKDSAIELQKKDTDSQKLLEEQGQVRAELEERIKYLEGREADSSKEAEAKLKEEKEAALKEQKTRFESRVKEIADQVGRAVVETEKQVGSQQQIGISLSLRKWLSKKHDKTDMR